MKTSCSLIFAFCLVAIMSSARAQEFFDDFEGTSIDTMAWTLVDRKWAKSDKRPHGGVVPENVYIKKGNLVIEAHGNNYSGPTEGHGQKTLVGGAISTINKYASGKYEIRAKICPQVGALSAFWTFYYENPEYNHEIDFEFPGHNQHPRSPEDSSLDWGLCTSYRTESENLNNDVFFGNQTDGEYHLYRFEWHTGGDGQEPRIDWFFDDKLMASNTDPEFIPTHVSNFWVGIWFPWWIGDPDFNTDHMYVDWVRITPFNEPGDDAAVLH